VFFGTNFGSRVAEATLGVGVLLTLEVHPAAKTIAPSSIPTTTTVEMCFRIMQPRRRRRRTLRYNFAYFLMRR